MKVLLSFLIILLFSNSFANAAITTASITTTNIAVATALKSTTTASVIASKNVVPSKNEFMEIYTTPSHTIIIYKCKNPESETKNWNDFRLLIALLVISIILCLYVSIVYP